MVYFLSYASLFEVEQSKMSFRAVAAEPVGDPFRIIKKKTTLSAKISPPHRVTPAIRVVHGTARQQKNPAGGVRHPFEPSYDV